MKNNPLLIVVLAILSSSCSPIINTFVDKNNKQQPSMEDVYIFTATEKFPDYSTPIGVFEFDPRSTPNCNFDRQSKLMIKKAQLRGANIIKIKSIQSSSDNCLHLTAELY